MRGISAEKERLQRAIQELDNKIAERERAFGKKRKAAEKRHFEMVEHIKRGNNQLKQQLLSLVRPTSKLRLTTAVEPARAGVDKIDVQKLDIEE
jgi:hypothetical protein